MPAGRPKAIYDKALANRVCEAIASGMSDRQAAENEGFNESWLRKLRAKFAEFEAQYVRARESRAEGYASQIIEIADEMPTCEVPDPDGGVSVRVDMAGIQRNKLRVDARKWVVCKLLPKIYGDKTAITGDGGGPLQIITSIPRPPK